MVRLETVLLGAATLGLLVFSVQYFYVLHNIYPQFSHLLIAVTNNYLGLLTLGANALLFAGVFAYLCIRIFVGSLFSDEWEDVNHLFRLHITETILSIVLSRSSSSYIFLIHAAVVLLLKTITTIIRVKVQNMGRDVTQTRFSYLRLLFFASCITILCVFCAKSVFNTLSLSHYRGTELFVLEYTVLAFTLLFTQARFLVSYYTLFHTPNHDFPSKPYINLLIDISSDLVKTTLLSTFCFYAIAHAFVPLHLIRELLLAAHGTLSNALRLVQYIKAKRTLTSALADCTPEELWEIDTTHPENSQTPESGSTSSSSSTTPDSSSPTANGAPGPNYTRICCAICRGELHEAKKLPCGHKFHYECVLGWMERDSRCPTCRADVNKPAQTARGTARPAAEPAAPVPPPQPLPGVENMPHRQRRRPTAGAGAAASASASTDAPRAGAGSGVANAAAAAPAGVKASGKSAIQRPADAAQRLGGSRDAAETPSPASLDAEERAALRKLLEHAVAELHSGKTNNSENSQQEILSTSPTSPAVSQSQVASLREAPITSLGHTFADTSAVAAALADIMRQRRGQTGDTTATSAAAAAAAGTSAEGAGRVGEADLSVHTDPLSAIEAVMGFRSPMTASSLSTAYPASSLVLPSLPNMANALPAPLQAAMHPLHSSIQASHIPAQSTMAALLAQSLPPHTSSRSVSLRSHLHVHTSLLQHHLDVLGRRRESLLAELAELERDMESVAAVYNSVLELQVVVGVKGGHRREEVGAQESRGNDNGGAGASREVIPSAGRDGVQEAPEEMNVKRDLVKDVGVESIAGPAAMNAAAEGADKDCGVEPHVNVEAKVSVTDAAAVDKAAVDDAVDDAVVEEAMDTAAARAESIVIDDYAPPVVTSPDVVHPTAGLDVNSSQVAFSSAIAVVGPDAQVESIDDEKAQSVDVELSTLNESAGIVGVGELKFPKHISGEITPDVSLDHEDITHLATHDFDRSHSSMVMGSADQEDVLRMLDATLNSDAGNKLNDKVSPQLISEPISPQTPTRSSSTTTFSTHSASSSSQSTSTSSQPTSTSSRSTSTPTPAPALTAATSLSPPPLSPLQSLLMETAARRARRQESEKDVAVNSPGSSSAGDVPEE